jgi:hypothetical protein
MLWHAVRLELGELDDEVRSSLEVDLAGLAELDVVEVLHVGRDIVDPTVTGLLVGLADEDALAVYRDHPDHRPVVQRLRELGVPLSRFDIHAGAGA